ncbi:MAG: Do family serine endopeptidase [Candidatus Aminicenantales bacterium]|jgi:serine protease Do
MKKYAWVALSFFFLGLVVAGYIFVYLPDKNAPQSGIFDKKPSAVPSSSLFASAPPEVRDNLDFVTISEKVGPAVVKIDAARREKVSPFGMDEGGPFEDFWDRFFGQQRPRQQQEQPVIAQGTGFFISPDGYILTNNHIVEKAEKVTVNTVQGKEYEAKVVGTDSMTDIALLKIEAKDMPFAELGDSAKMKVGEWVLAIGNPYGLANTVTAGIVSAKGRDLDPGDPSTLQDFIQTDTAINRGNSGGPLINMRAEVIGITSNIFTPTGGNIGIGFAIPSNMARKVVVQLKEKGRVTRGRLGVQVQNISDGMMKQLKLKSKEGAIIAMVDPDSPAEKANLKQYDVITEINGQPVKDMSDLRIMIADIAPGQKAVLKIIRDGKETTATAVVEDREAASEKGQVAAPDKNIGLSLQPLTSILARRYGLRTNEGLLITEVQPFSEAARKGLEPGMVILEVNRNKVTSVREFETILKKSAADDEIILLVRIESQNGTQDNIVTLKVR